MYGGKYDISVMIKLSHQIHYKKPVIGNRARNHTFDCTDILELHTQYLSHK